jgi:hypothetical protein
MADPKSLPDFDALEHLNALLDQKR